MTKKYHRMIPAIAGCLLIALIALARNGLCLQVALQHKLAPAESAAMMATIQQQQQQQQQSVQQQQTMINQQPPDQTASQPAKQAAAKSNHRLVSKLKDHARHRRRHRHHRHRHYHQLAEKSMLALKDPQSSATTLTALESIVEEVARAGQMPAPSSMSQQQVSGQQQQVQQQQQQQVSAAASASEILLDGSSSPISHVQQAPNQQQQQAQPTQSLQHQPPAPITRDRGSSYNSRGFFLTSMLSKIMNVLNVTEFALEMRDGISSRASCMACNAVVGLFMSPLYSKEVFSAAIRTVCTSFKIQSARVCSGLAESFQDDFEFIRKNTKLTRDEVCAVVFGVDCARRHTYNLFWTVHIPDLPNKSHLEQSSAGNSLSLPMNEQALTNMEDAPDLFEYRKSSAVALSSPGLNANTNVNTNEQPKQQQQQQQQQASTARPSGKALAASEAEIGPKNIHKTAESQMSAKVGMIKRPEYVFDDDLDNESQANEGRNKMSTFVHITDIHIDPFYETGSLNDCNEPLCCRATSGPVPLNDKRRQAGAWGDYGNCDTPVRTLHNALNRIREHHQNVSFLIKLTCFFLHD